MKLLISATLSILIALIPAAAVADQVAPLDAMLQDSRVMSRHLQSDEYTIRETVIFEDGTEAILEYPDFEALKAASRQDPVKAARAANIAGCTYFGTSQGSSWTNCQVRGSTLNIFIAYRIDYNIDRYGRARITRNWDEQARSNTGSLSPMGFSKPSASAVTYKVAWTSYLGAPSWIYTLAVSINSAGGANVQLYT